MICRDHERVQLPPKLPTDSLTSKDGTIHMQHPWRHSHLLLRPYMLSALMHHRSTLWRGEEER